MDMRTEQPAAPAGRGRRSMLVLWPSFLMAGVLEALVFSMVDPAALHWPNQIEPPLSNTAIYTLAFLAFWAITALASGLSLWLADTPGEPPR